MKDGIPAWSVVVVVVNKNDRVLAITRNFSARNPALPGGDSVESDVSPAATARRELFEETGVTARSLRCVERWDGERGQSVFVFFVPKWTGGRLRASPEGKPFWTTPETLFKNTAQYSGDAKKIFATLEQLVGNDETLDETEAV